jgi:outer membrane lipoprotein-sorting protein
MSMLSTGPKIMYVYSPQTDNVRRVASSAKRQTLLGSNLTYTDMQSAPLSELYDATFGPDDGAFAWLELTPKAGAEVAWTKLRVRVDKKTKMAQTLEYFDGAAKKRVEVRSKHESWDGTPTYRHIEMKTLDDGLITSLDVEKQTINGDVADSLFKKRNLVRGN